MSAEQPQKIKLEASPEQLKALAEITELAKALAAPGRLALLGALAAHPGQSLSLEELSRLSGQQPPRLERDLRQLIELGWITVEEWRSERAGREPVAARLRLEDQYFKKLPAIITALHQLQRPAQPAGEPASALDEEAKTLRQFMRDGRLVGMPAQFKRQVYVLEEVAKVFEPGLRYSERQVDAILKDIYEYDYCGLRRALVDLRFLRRADGIYWKEPRAATPD